MGLCDRDDKAACIKLLCLYLLVCVFETALNLYIDYVRKFGN